MLLLDEPFEEEDDDEEEFEEFDEEFEEDEESESPSESLLESLDSLRLRLLLRLLLLLIFIMICFYLPYSNVVIVMNIIDDDGGKSCLVRYSLLSALSPPWLQSVYVWSPLLMAGGDKRELTSWFKGREKITTPVCCC